MSQRTLDDEDLFGEAAEEIRSDVENSLAAARDELPDPDDVWEVEADNVLGVLNGLKSALDADAAREEFRDAKKWYTMGERAGAFDEDDELADEMDALEDVLDDVEAASEDVTDLVETLPELRSALAED
ncbi:MAG: DUF5790 family protein [Halobacteriaceae archaeon]